MTRDEAVAYVNAAANSEERQRRKAALHATLYAPMSDVALDAAADGQFQPKLGDPSDGLTKRGGKGYVLFEGREYSRLEWTIRLAENGATLAAGEGALLVAELARVRALVRAAYVEGATDYYEGTYRVAQHEQDWVESRTYAELTGTL